MGWIADLNMSQHGSQLYILPPNHPNEKLFYALRALLIRASEPHICVMQDTCRNQKYAEPNQPTHKQSMWSLATQECGAEPQ